MTSRSNLSPGELRFVSLASAPEFEAVAESLGERAWPEFLFHNDIQHWSSLVTTFAPFQFVLLDSEGEVRGVGHTVPLVWDGTDEDLPTGIDDIIERALRDEAEKRPRNTLSALAAIVPEAYQGGGISTAILRAMIALADRNGLATLIAPVRPTWKSRHPEMPFNDYIRMSRDDGAPYDPWLRVHWRLKGRRRAIAPKAMTVTGSVAEWEGWTGRAFPESGSYAIPGGLVPVVIDRTRNVGLYEEPNVWIAHAVVRP